MNKNRIILIIIILMLFCSVGAYLFSNGSILGNIFSTGEYLKNESNISANDSIDENLREDGTGIANDNFTNKSNILNSSINNQIPNTKTIHSTSDITKEANKILNSNKGFFGKNAVVKNVNYNGNGLWSVDFVDSRTNKKVGTTYIDDSTGEMVDAM